MSQCRTVADRHVHLKCHLYLDVGFWPQTLVMCRHGLRCGRTQRLKAGVFKFARQSLGFISSHMESIIATWTTGGYGRHYL